jgi:hypothetical protein
LGVYEVVGLWLKGLRVERMRFERLWIEGLGG